MGEGVTLTKEAYTELVNADIKALNKYMPEHSIEKWHIRMVLQWSIDKEFPPVYCKNVKNDDAD